MVVSCPPEVRISPSDFVRFKGGEKSRETHRLQGEISLETLGRWSRHERISIVLAPGAVPQVARATKQEELVAA